MLVQGHNLGIEPIRTENKQGNEDIKRLHYEINDVLYQYNKAYIAPHTAKRIIAKLTELGKKLKQVNVDGAEALKANEILQTLRVIITNIKMFMNEFRWDESDKEIIQKILNYFVYMYVEDKKKGMMDSQILKHLKKQQEIMVDFVVPSGYKTLNTTQFSNANNELLNLINNKYSYNKMIRN